MERIPRGGKEAMVGKLKRKLGALKFASKFSTYNTRLKLANGCIMSIITYGIQVWGLHCRPSVLKKVQSVQLNTLKWVTGNYFGILNQLLKETKWLSVFQLAIYHSVLLLWKVRTFGKPDRLVRRLKSAEDTVARLLITERIWSRTAERYFRRVENELNGVQKISEAKTVLRNWIKTTLPIHEEN